MRQFQCVPTAYVTEIKETYFEIYIYQESCPFNCFVSLKHLNLPISIKIPITIWQIVYINLQDSYFTKFDFMNYAFAKLVVASLYLFGQRKLYI